MDSSLSHKDISAFRQHTRGTLGLGGIPSQSDICFSKSDEANVQVKLLGLEPTLVHLGLCKL